MQLLGLPGFHLLLWSIFIRVHRVIVPNLNEFILCFGLVVSLFLNFFFLIVIIKRNSSTEWYSYIPFCSRWGDTTTIRILMEQWMKSGAKSPRSCLLSNWWLIVTKGLWKGRWLNQTAHVCVQIQLELLALSDCQFTYILLLKVRRGRYLQKLDEFMVKECDLFPVKGEKGDKNNLCRSLFVLFSGLFLYDMTFSSRFSYM